MKNIKNLSKRLALMAGLGLGCAGCVDMDLSPLDQGSSGAVWSDPTMAEQTVNGVYNVLYYGYNDAWLGWWDCWSYMMDLDANWIGGFGALLGNNTSSNDRCSTRWWQVYYGGIFRANDVIQNMPNVPGMDEGMKSRLVSEARFLRSWWYYRLNALYGNIPYYTEALTSTDDTKDAPQCTQDEMWDHIIADLTLCIDDPNLPDKYAAGDGNYGHITKGAAYALRGLIYMWKENWSAAISDFQAVQNCGYALYTGSGADSYKQLFKLANEQCDEMIFSLQCIDLSGYGNNFTFRYGSRVSYGSCWNTYLASTDFVDTYECADGKPFNWNDYIPGYNEMAPAARSVYFLRDGMTDEEKTTLAAAGADMSKYLDSGNEARILAAYTNRDPRLQMTIITPYSQYLGSINSTDYTYTLRWPYRQGSDTAEPFDLRTDTNNRFYYLFRKFVAEGSSEIPNREYSPLDIPIIRYADVVLSLAECLNEQGRTDEAITYVNMVRQRAGAALLNSNQYTQVTGQDNMRERIRNERRWEFAGEGVNFFDEMRWRTWHESKMFDGAGLKQIWGEMQSSYSWGGDYLYNWAIPRTEIQMNTNLEQNDGWID